MNSPRTHVHHRWAPGFLALRPRDEPLGPSWREGATIAGGIVVLLVTTWLIWAALAEAALAIPQVG